MALYFLELFPSILLLLLHSRTAHADSQISYCAVASNSTDTTFKNNLDGLLKSITTGAQNNGGFFNDTVGTSTDQIYGLAICYADGNLTTCNSCLSSVASNITSDCPVTKLARFRLDTGPCFIRYSNENFFSVSDSTTSTFTMNPYNFSDHELFGNARNALFDKLIAQTNASANMLASGEENVNGTDKLYGLLQCTRDLNHQECYKCLSTLINILQPPSLYAYSLGVQLFGFSCYVHYEMHPFMLTLEGILADRSTSNETAPSPRNPFYRTAGSLSVTDPNIASAPAVSGKPYDRTPSPETAPSPRNPVHTTGSSVTVPGQNRASPPAVESVPSPPPALSPPVTVSVSGNALEVVVIVAVVGGVAFLLVVLAICIWRQKRRSNLGRTNLLIEELQEVAASEFLIYNLTTIRVATDNFSDKNTLGRGGFGPVFKGTLPNGQEIAVKRLSTSSTQGETEFKNEVELLVRLRHNNLVQLLGCCISKQEKMLCYEYLPNGSLDKILFGTYDIKCKELEWSRRFRIIKGICRGLLYLHEESPLKIVHRDLKASNILLDGDMNPKIADFGLARLFDRDKTHTVTTHFAGTFGYIAPEYSIRGTFSAKSDTYSFGILVLEIVSGRKNSSFPGSEYMSGLINHVWKNWSEGKILELKDPTLDEECIEEVTKCIHIAFLCLQKNPSERPNMESVANMLNSSSIVSLPPLPPPRFIWGADVPTFEDDENVVANFSREYSVVGVETTNESFLSSFYRRA